jgi:ferredoxin
MNATFRLPDGSSRTIEVKPRQRLLHAAEEAGLQLPYSCRSGSCADCLAKVVCGKVDQKRAIFLNEQEKAAGYCLTCVAIPLTDCVLDTHQKRSRLHSAA